MTMSRKTRVVITGMLGVVLLGASAVWWGYAHLTTLVQDRLRSVLGQEFTVGRVTARWNRVELEQVRLGRIGPGPFRERLSVARIVIAPSLSSLLKGHLHIPEIRLERPHLLLEIAPDGKLIMPLPATRKTGKGAAPPALPLSIGALQISDGSLDLLDWHVSRTGGVALSNPREQYHLVRLEQIRFDLGRIDIPGRDRLTPVSLKLSSAAGGRLELSGDVSPQLRDARLRLAVVDLNITAYRPYYLKKGDLMVSQGLLSAQSDIRIEKRKLTAPGTITLKKLAFEQSGVKGYMMGLPTWALLGLMSDQKGDLTLSFSLSGSLDNPRFAIRQSLLEQVATGLASKAGISTVGSIGKGIVNLGGKGVKGIMGIFGGK